MSTIFCVLGTELNGAGAGAASVSFRSTQMESTLVMALALNVVFLQVMGFSSVTPTTILVGSFNRMIREVGCLLPLTINSPIQFYCLSKFCGCDNLGSQSFFINQEGLFNYWTRVCSLRCGHILDVKCTRCFRTTAISFALVP